MASSRRPWLKPKKVPSPFWREVLAEAGAQPTAEVKADNNAFPGRPGSYWRDIDGDMWIHGDDGRMWLISLRSEPRDPAGLNKCYGPMTRIEGGEQ